VWEKINLAKPLWMRAPKDVASEEYAEFYKQTFKAYDEPAAHAHFNLEGQVEFRAITNHSSLITHHSSLMTNHSSLITNHSSLITNH
jgi:heat shock protein beta